MCLCRPIHHPDTSLNGTPRPILMRSSRGRDCLWGILPMSMMCSVSSSNLISAWMLNGSQPPRLPLQQVLNSLYSGWVLTCSCFLMSSGSRVSKVLRSALDQHKIWLRSAKSSSCGRMTCAHRISSRSSVRSQES